MDRAAQRIWLVVVLGIGASCGNDTASPSHDGGGAPEQPDAGSRPDAGNDTDADAANDPDAGSAGGGACSWQPVIAGFDVPAIAALVADPAHERLVIFSDPPATARITAVELGATPRLHALAPAGELPPSDLDDASIALDADRARVLLYGGTRLNRAESGVFALALDADPVWSVLAVTGDAPARTAHAAAIDTAGARMFVFGGVRDESSAHGDVFVLSLDDAPAWSRITPSEPAPEGRFDFAVAWDAGNDRLLVRGGRQPRALRDLWALTPDPDPAWQELAPDPPLPALAVTNSSVADVYDPVAGALLVVAVRDVTAATTGPRRVELFRLPLAGRPDGFSLVAAHDAPVASSVSSYPAAYDGEADRLYLAINWSTAGRANEIWTLALAPCR